MPSKFDRSAAAHDHREDARRAKAEAKRLRREARKQVKRDAK